MLVDNDESAGLLNGDPLLIEKPKSGILSRSKMGIKNRYSSLEGFALKYKKVDKISRVTGESIGVRWTFTRYNTKSKVTERVPAESIPLHIRNTQNEQDVIAYCNSQSAIEDAAVYRAKMRSQWRKKYHNYETLLEKFTDYQKERAPNSYKNDVYYLEAYAFHYFLDKKENATYWQWSLHYNDFKTWLRTAKPS